MAFGTTILDTYQLVQVGGTAIGDIIGSAGWADLYGVASGTTISGGGSAIISFGGTASDTVLISSGGTELVAATGTASGVTFAGTSGVLELYQPSSLSGTLSRSCSGPATSSISWARRR